MARVLGFKTRLPRQVEHSLAAQWRELGKQYAFGVGAHAAAPRSARNRRFTGSPIDALVHLVVEVRVVPPDLNPARFIHHHPPTRRCLPTAVARVPG
jgi:hypothetical protein